ncbi:LamG-like jellyroll fold domain-containing protein [Streptomyces sp. NPDC051909]|uniref:LamG-like jellyroll fold domain-containing protein n=1 Tax=Streptomyces sp. NPDC051909 TaxID=3154944 RepID=UPI003433F929
MALSTLPAVGLAPLATAADGATATTATTEGSRALAAAKKSGERVEVVGDRTERSTVYANPDGFSFTLEESTVPVRVAKPGGGWQAPDATLERRPDGSVAPKAAAVEMDFSGGGTGSPLVRIEDAGRSIELGWPGKLPKPELDGASALYRNVYADVDLKVTASVEGFKHVLIVKTPQAAARAELRRIDYTMKANGLTIVKGATGNLTAVDADGEQVFRAPRAQMWDSAGAARSRAAAGAKAATGTGAKTAAAADAAPGTPAAGATAPSDPVETGAGPAVGAAPAAGDTVTTMDVKLSRGSLAVVPDAKMLTGSKAANFPLYIDPTVTWGEDERTLLRSDGYESYGFGNGSDNEGQGVGKCGTWSGYYCGSGYVQRLYFEFSPASLKGKKVLDATFRATETWSFTCDARWVDLVRTNNISSATTWSGRPTELDWMGDRYVSAGRGTACSPSQPAAAIEFNDNPEETNENLTPTVRDFAAGKFSRLTLELRANDETDTSAWKRFRNDAVLAVKYVALPALPTEVGLVAGTSYVCSTSSSAPTVVSDPTPSVTGRPQTAAGGESGASLRMRWRTEKWDGAAWVTAHTDVDSPTSGYVGDNVKQTRSLPTLSEGVSYRLKALTLSYYEDGSNRLNTGYTTPCYFKVDPTAPKAPKITFGGPYSECTPNACIAAGGPGTAGKFTFAPATGDTNNVAYQYRLSLTDTWKSAGSGSTVTPSITPSRSGTHRLYVQAKDNVGRWGAENAVDFLVAAGQGPLARWRFDEASGAALDSAGNATRYDATLAGSAVRDDRGRRGLLTHDANGVELATPVTDKGLALNGTSAYAATAGPVLETRSSYTVSAWVRVVDGSKNRTFVSQDGVHRSSFYLGYEAAGGKLTFRAVDSDAPANGSWSYSRVTAAQPVALGAWTHVTGVYDATKKELSFYVNGRLQGRTPYTTAFQTSGPMQIGRVHWSDVYTDYVAGSVDEVAVWQRPLLDSEVADEARLLISEGFAAAELVADWSAARGTGTTIPDTTSGYGKALTLSGGAVLDGQDLVLDGVDDAATASAPLLDDTSSFTVTTLAELDKAKVLTKPVGYVGQVLGQRTADGSSWGLWFQLTGKETVLDPDTLEEKTNPVGVWHFGRLNADGTFTSVVSDEAAALDSPVRLTGVHDAVSGTISLYLGHNQNGVDEAYTATAGSGEFAVGKGYTKGVWQHQLPARINEVRLWAGAMAGSEQIDHRVGD